MKSAFPFLRSLPRFALVAALPCVLVAACTAGPNFHRPAAPADAGYTAEKMVPETVATNVAGGDVQRFVEAQDVPGQWWALFRSDSLNALIDEALKANPDLAAAQASLRQANETVAAEQGSLFPAIGGGASVTREKLSSASLTGVSGTTAGGRTSVPPFNVMSASLNVSYALDVFGGVRRQIESAKARAEYERFELEATYLTLTSNVVNTAVAVASLRDQVAALEQIIQMESDQLAIVGKQFDIGAVNKTDVLGQQTTLAQSRAALPPLQKQLKQAENQLKAYLGRFPNAEKIEGFALTSLSLPDELPVSLPSKLVEQRPDVRAAEALLHEASANVGIAVANQLPQFAITGDLGTAANSFAKMFTSGTGFWSIAGAITQPIFDGGALEHRKRAAVAAYDASAARYRGAVLAAFQDVANALHAVEVDAEALKAQVLAEQSARDSLELARQQYKIGAINYLTLLNAQQAYENALVNRVRAQATRYSDTVALFQALGGGWWNRSDVDPKSRGSHDRLTLPPVLDVKVF
jgi:NodT family efflux transporter outer membrane factor (OMF) lipoprotein